MQRPAPPGAAREPFYVPIGAFQGELYARNAFAQGTDAEVEALIARADLHPSSRVLDVGCGDGRHLRALVSHGVRGVGVDASPALIEAARRADEPSVTFVIGDARDLGSVPEVAPGSFDAAWSLCQGGFGTHPGTDRRVMQGLADAVRPGGIVVVTAFHALFAVRHLAPGDAFDPVSLTHHQLSEVRGRDGARADFDLWTAAYTVRDLLALAREIGLQPVAIAGCEPGRYGSNEVRLDDPELLLTARRPDDATG